MENIIYRGVYLDATDSPDGETPHCYIVTKEINGYAIWHQTSDATMIYQFGPWLPRDEAIETAVSITQKARAENNYTKL